MRRVLIAEDEVFSRILLKRTLEAAGFLVEAVDNGKDALARLLHPEGPNLAVLDKNLPGISGPEICRCVRQEKEIPYRFLVILTATTTPESKREAFENGADAFLGKPFDPVVILAEMEAGMGKVEKRSHPRSGS